MVMQCRWAANGYLSGMRGICTIFSHYYRSCQAVSAPIDIFWAAAGNDPGEAIDRLQ
jgi:hypothetical protein